MKRLHYAKAHTLNLLHDEIITAIPALAPIRDDAGDGTPVMTAVEGKGTDIWLTVPDDADEAAIQAVVDAHDATATRQKTAETNRVSGRQKLVTLGLTDDEITALVR